MRRLLSISTMTAVLAAAALAGAPGSDAAAPASPAPGSAAAFVSPASPTGDLVTLSEQVAALDPGTGDDDLGALEGTPSLPTGDVTMLKQRQEAIRPQASAADRTVTVPISRYYMSPAVMQPVAVGTRGYEDTKVWPRGGWGTRDSTGVRMFVWPGETKQWNHPVGQAQYAIHNLNSYRLTKDPVYLETARKNAQRLVDRRVESAGAWYYPYDFNFSVHGDTTQMLRAPWYSAMAQGQALSAFVRMFEATNDPQWRLAADATFLSLLQAPDSTAPFSSRVDTKGRLWFEEYPRYPVADSEMVLNGHIFAMYGLHDYWQLTKDDNARKLFLGGLSTIERSVLTEYRRPTWLSVYSLRHQVNTHSYHRIHIGQFLVLWRLTKDNRWVEAATAFRNDYPTEQQTGQLRITPKVRTIYKISSTGGIASSRTVSFARLTGAPYDRRQRLQGGPIAYRVTAGAYAGWWFPEGYGVAWGLGAIDQHGYFPETPVVFRGGTTFTAYRLDSAGNVAGSKTLTISSTRVSGAPTRYSGVVLGRPSYYFYSGAFAGYWVPLQSKVYLP